MKEYLNQVNHLADVLYTETKGLYTITRSKANLLQDIIDDMQDMIDRIVNELLEVTE